MKKARAKLNVVNGQNNGGKLGTIDTFVLDTSKVYTTGTKITGNGGDVLQLTGTPRKSLTVDLDSGSLKIGKNEVKFSGISFVDARKLDGRLHFEDKDSSGSRVSGSKFADHIVGSSGRDVYHGNDGNDFIYGGAGSDKLYGGAGDDTIDGGAGRDLIYGGAGRDSITAGDGDDRIFGGAGSDTINAGAGNDVIFGGSSTTESSNKVYGGDGNDRFYVFNKSVNDFYGGAGNDIVYFNGVGSSLVNGLHGGEGKDELNYVKSKSGVAVALDEEAGHYWQGNNGWQWRKGEQPIRNDYDRASGFEIVRGSKHNDVFYGSIGKDSIYGGAGNDVINGGRGDDFLHGGEGNDVFSFSSFAGDFGTDTIADFSRGSDKIDLRAFAITTDNFKSRVTIQKTADEKWTVGVKDGSNVVYGYIKLDNKVTMDDFIL